MDEWSSSAGAEVTGDGLGEGLGEKTWVALLDGTGVGVFGAGGGVDLLPHPANNSTTDATSATDLGVTALIRPS